MSVATEVTALRSSAGLSKANHVAIVRVDGPDALDFLQIASTQSPYVREGRVRHTLLLRDDASVLADAFVVNVDDGFLVLAEGPDEPARRRAFAVGHGAAPVVDHARRHHRTSRRR